MLCDDGDPCTDDGCVGGVCENVPKVGLDAVTCGCTAALPTACDGQAIPPRVEHYATRACGLFAQAVDAPARRERRRLRQGVRALHRAVNVAVHAQLHGLAPECASALTARYRLAIDQAVTLADTL